MMATEIIKDKEELKVNLIDVLNELKFDKVKTKKIKDGMKEHKILAGTVQKWINHSAREIPELGMSELYLFSEQIHIHSGVNIINPQDYFTPREIKEIKTTFQGYTTEEIKFPYTFKRKADRANDAWFLLVSVTELRLLNNGKEIQYNPNVQRSSKVKHLNEETVIPIPKIFPKSVSTMESLFAEGKLKSTQLTFNARYGSADDDDNGEVFFDEETGELTIAKGTMFDCLDGFNRITAVTRGQEKHPDKEMYFMLKITNTSEAEAKREFTQINTINAQSKSQLHKMDQDKFENSIVDYLDKNSELKDRIVSENVVSQKSDKLVSYSILSDAIEENFNIKTRGESIKIGKYLAEFFNEICFAYPDEFLGDVISTKDVSIINSNVTFYGYIILAKKFLDSDMPLKNISTILESIDFSRTNKEWVNYDIIDSKGRNTRNAKKGIKKYFSELKIN